MSMKVMRVDDHPLFMEGLQYVDATENTIANNLTERQLEILEMIARGSTYKEVGESLGLTERTIKYHMGRIIEVLHLKNRAQVIAYAARMGLVKDEGIGK